MQILKVLNDLFEAREQHEITMLRQASDEKLKYSRILHVVLEIALQHRKLIKVGEQYASGRLR